MRVSITYVGSLTVELKPFAVLVSIIRETRVTSYCPPPAEAEVLIRGKDELKNRKRFCKEENIYGEINCSGNRKCPGYPLL